MKRLLLTRARVDWRHRALADTGVLIPGDRQQPDPAVFSLNEMALEIRIDNGIARVRVRQIFGNHSADHSGGRLPIRAARQGDGFRFRRLGRCHPHPGRDSGAAPRRRNLRAGESPGHRSRAAANGRTHGRRGRRTASAQPGVHRPHRAHSARSARSESRWNISIRCRWSGIDPSSWFRSSPMSMACRRPDISRSLSNCDPRTPSRISRRWPRSIRCRYANARPNLVQSGVLRQQRGVERGLCGALRAGSGGGRHAPRDHRARNRHRTGILSGAGSAAHSGASAGTKLHAAAPRHSIVLFDNSLSMQWDKLERSFAACETALRRLRPADSFNLLLFNSEVNLFAPQPRPATPQNIEQALAFIRNSRIRGGTELQRALTAALAQTSTSEPYLMLISDGGATEGAVHNGKLAAWYAARVAQTSRRPDGRTRWCSASATMPTCRCFACSRATTATSIGCGPRSPSNSSSMRFWTRSARSR